jgi:hypothetical protein
VFIAVSALLLVLLAANIALSALQLRYLRSRRQFLATHPLAVTDFPPETDRLAFLTVLLEKKYGLSGERWRETFDELSGGEERLLDSQVRPPPPLLLSLFSHLSPLQIRTFVEIENSRRELELADHYTSLLRSVPYPAPISELSLGAIKSPTTNGLL